MPDLVPLSDDEDSDDDSIHTYTPAYVPPTFASMTNRVPMPNLVALSDDEDSDADSDNGAPDLAIDADSDDDEPVVEGTPPLLPAAVSDVQATLIANSKLRLREANAEAAVKRRRVFES